MASKNQLLTSSTILVKDEKKMLFLFQAHKELEKREQDEKSKIDISGNGEKK